MHANAESAVDQGHVPIFIIPHAPSLAGRRRSHTTTGYTDTSDSLRLHSYPSASADKHTPAEIAEPLATSPSPGTMTEDGREADHTSRSLVNRGREHIAFGIPRWAAHRLVFLFNDFFFIFFFFLFEIARAPGVQLTDRSIKHRGTHPRAGTPMRRAGRIATPTVRPSGRHTAPVTTKANSESTL